MRLVTLLQWLHGKTSALFTTPFWQMMVWLAFMIDHSNVLTIASADPLDFPAHVGPRGGSMRLHAAKRHNIVMIAAEGRLARSGRAACEILQELRPGFTMKNVRSGNNWISGLSLQYLHKLQCTFKFDTCEPVYSLSWDATRLSKRDTLVCTIYNADLDMAGWVPPQVLIVTSSSTTV